VTLVDPTHALSSLYNLGNVPSAVWIDESGHVRRVDEGAYAEVHEGDDFKFGRADYAPIVADWVAKGEASEYLRPVGELKLPAKSADQARGEVFFKLGVYFQQMGNDAKANQYWERAEALDPDSWNYHRQDWAFTPEEAGANWLKKYQTLNGKPYYRPIEGLDKGQ
jgi:hypothetical protein